VERSLLAPVPAMAQFKVRGVVGNALTAEVRRRLAYAAAARGYRRNTRRTELKTSVNTRVGTHEGYAQIR